MTDHPLNQTTAEDALCAAREQGWDDAVDWAYRTSYLNHYASKRAHVANPYRPTPALPTGDGAVIVPAEGFEFIWVEGGRYFDRLTYSGRLRRWYGVAVGVRSEWAAFWYGEPEKITPGTWKVDDQ